MRKSTLLISFLALATVVFPIQTEGKGSGSYKSTIQQKRDQERAERYKERLRKIEKSPKENRRTKEQPIKIIGDDEFIKKTEEALALIREKAPKFYVSVTNYIGIIKAYEKTGMAAYLDPPTSKIGLKTAEANLTWYASMIVHETNHSKQYNDYRKNVNKKVPNEIWTGRAAEDACLDVQEAFLKEINAPERFIKAVQRARHIDYFSDAKSRDW